MYQLRLHSYAAKFAQCREGNFAIIFALLIPLLLGLAGGAVDMMVFNRQQSQMQDTADAAALAAAKEASLKNWSQVEADAVAKAYVTADLANGGVSATAAFAASTSVDNVKHEVTVTLEMDQHQYFLLGYFRGSPQIRVVSTARFTGETPTCLLTLDGAASKSYDVTGSANIFATGCAAYANSKAKDAISVKPGAVLKTAFTCSAGGFAGSGGSYSPNPTTDCPVFDDPLAARPQPSVGACDFKDFSLKNTTATINPGVYCNGLSIDNKANVTMNPGVYIINGGEFATKNNGSVTGKGVTIFFTGKDGRLSLDGTTTVSLSAPDNGPTAGLLLFQDRAMALTEYEISSKTASQLLGTIYLPNGRFKVKAPGKVADQSAFTVIVSRLLEVGSSTQMYMNTDYAATTVPVPDGLGPSQKFGLVH